MEIAIVGAVVSLIVQVLKKYVASSEYLTLAAVLVISLLAAAGYTFLVSAGYWQTFAGVLVTAGAFYTYILARF